jgi:hypothetical protein
MLTSNDLINHKFPLEIRKLLLKRGSPLSSFSPVNFDIDTAIVRIVSDIPGLNIRTVSPERQLNKLRSINQNIIGTNYVMVVSSFPSDNIAKYLALSLMYKAYYVYVQKKKQPRYNKLLAPPLWHRLYNNFKNQLLDEKQNPCLLVISNISADSTQLKFEKLSDLLDLYEDIPRIVVTSGQLDPVSFAAKAAIHSTVNTYLGPQDRKRIL